MVLSTGLCKKLVANKRPFTKTLLGLIPALWLIWVANIAEAGIDIELRERLITALASDDKVNDRFDMTVWITDMEARLETYIDDPHTRLQLLQHVYREARRVDLPPELILAVIHIESNFDRFAISRVGARGLMQIMPFWLTEIGRPKDNLFNIETNLRLGCTILRHYLDKERGEINEALARYNGSQGKRRYPDKIFDKLRRHWYRS